MLRNSWLYRIALLACLSADTQAQPCAVLLHGLARTEGSMEPLAAALFAAGYQAVNLGYASREQTVEQLAITSITPALTHCKPAEKVHFVTHSLGGILVRQYLKAHTIPQLGRVVMLGPPNQGSEVVDRLGSFPGFGWLNGPAGKELGTGTDSLPKHLGPANFEVGIIAGTRTFNPLLSQFLPNPDDGKVSVASTRLEGMADHLQLPVTHTFMMRDAEVIRQVLAFLADGKFQREASLPQTPHD